MVTRSQLIELGFIETTIAGVDLFWHGESRCALNSPLTSSQDTITDVVDFMLASQKDWLEEYHAEQIRDFDVRLDADARN